jgi:hypothetical protein
MKRAKIAISALAVLAVAGGSLAFKAHEFNAKKLFIKSYAATTKTTVQCSLVSSVTTTVASAIGARKVYFTTVTTTALTTICPTVNTTYTITPSNDNL